MEKPPSAHAPPPPASLTTQTDPREDLAGLIRDVRPRDTHGLLEAMWALGRLSKLDR